ncbi:unnamed protein product [Phytophthora fragariaefolia]|uniref:Unnamed protein product n=1 Tax=Phytophthora fragariaefolia TaxID=1490495 RepID=A0A9W6Y184_9STRA|nr:unnamed protein product [Phytophthora fragariaefolia]
MAACSDVTTCLSEGSTECSLSSETCPPCVYALTGGDYSCYSRDTSGDCPFSGTYAECDKSSSYSSTKKSTSTDKDKSGDTTPTPTTKTPAKTTAAPSTSTDDSSTPATSTPETSTPETSAPETIASDNADTGTTGTTGTTDTTGTASSQTNSDDSTSTTQGGTTPSTTTASSDSDVTQSSQATSNSVSDKGTEQALTSSTATTSGSPAVVNLALIGGAVMLVVIVIAFVARRASKKKMAHTQERTISSQNSAWSDRTLGTATSGGNLYSTYSYKDEGGVGKSYGSDSQASSTYGPAYPGQMAHSEASPRPTADFSTYGSESQYSENSQYSDYGVSTGPELLPVGAVAGHYGDTNMPPSATGPSSFVNVTATSANRGSELDSMRSGHYPLTVSQLMPTAIDEDEEDAYANRRAAPRGYNMPTAVPPSTRNPQIYAASGVSATSSMRSDYDIVDPITMQDVEARNTEMMAENGQYPKFSFESEADIYDGGSSSGEESSDDERVRHGEHTI